jgi:hypothetical protein
MMVLLTEPTSCQVSTGYGRRRRQPLRELRTAARPPRAVTGHDEDGQGA